MAAWPPMQEAPNKEATMVKLMAGAMLFVLLTGFSADLAFAAGKSGGGNGQLTCQNSYDCTPYNGNSGKYRLK